tara:strand:+ start:385 stop:516 length:132 start_codon:yes stop_codon:yes gene_type:complete
MLELKYNVLAKLLIGNISQKNLQIIILIELVYIINGTVVKNGN